MQQAIQRIRGFSDRNPDDQFRAAATIRTLLDTFQLADYAEISVPVIESLDLYVRKSGAQILPTIYGFVDQGKQEVALRPEFTASVIRAFGPAVGPDGPPLRVCYAGPVFRYEAGDDQQVPPDYAGRRRAARGRRGGRRGRDPRPRLSGRSRDLGIPHSSW